MGGSHACRASADNGWSASIWRARQNEKARISAGLENVSLLRLFGEQWRKRPGMAGLLSGLFKKKRLISMT